MQREIKEDVVGILTEESNQDSTRARRVSRNSIRDNSTRLGLEILGRSMFLVQVYVLRRSFCHPDGNIRQ